MPPITIRSPPSLDDYTPLAEHESRTPETFFGGKPVLYYHAAGVKAWIPASQRGSGLPFFTADSNASAPSGPEAASLNGTAEELVEQVVDLFVTSQSFTLFSPSAECGLSIPYPSITLHAIKHLDSSPAGGAKLSAVYLQLELSDRDPDDEDFDTTELTLLPPSSPANAAPVAGDSEAATPTTGTQTETRKLFDAISACSNLHPDPALGNSDDEDDGAAAGGTRGAVFSDDRIIFEGDGARPNATAIPGLGGAVLRGAADGSLPPPMPGSSGWITAENMHEFFDGDGNWIGGGGAGEDYGEDDGEEAEGDGAEGGISGELGDGAGRVRRRDEDGTQDGGEANGHGEGVGDAESKRPRTE